MLDRCNAMDFKQFREHPHHGFPVFHHVGNTGRGASVVLQNIEVIFPDTDKIRSDDVGIHLAGRCEANHLRQESLILDDQICRNAPRPDNLLTVINVMEEGI